MLKNAINSLVVIINSYNDFLRNGHNAYLSYVVNGVSYAMSFTPRMESSTPNLELLFNPVLNSINVYHEKERRPIALAVG